MLMILDRAPRYPDAPTDARGNPIPDSWRGQPINPTIRALDPYAPFTVPDGVTAHTQVGCLVHLARTLRGRFDGSGAIDDTVLEAALACGRAYDVANLAPEPQRRPALAARDPVTAALTSRQRQREKTEHYGEYVDAEP
jgi:hypothetical protein